MVELAEIVEMVELDCKTANYYLQHGYYLLAITPRARSSKRPDGQYYVKRDVIFVLGRTSDVAHIEPPQEEEK